MRISNFKGLQSKWFTGVGLRPTDAIADEKQICLLLWKRIRNPAAFPLPSEWKPIDKVVPDDVIDCGWVRLLQNDHNRLPVGSSSFIEPSKIWKWKNIFFKHETDCKDNEIGRYCLTPSASAIQRRLSWMLAFKTVTLTMKPWGAVKIQIHSELSG